MEENKLDKDNFLTKNKEFDIFLSYQWDHKPLVRSLYQKLTKMKYKVWMDEAELDSSNLYDQLSEGLINSKLFLCCITKKYAESDNCVREINLAIANKKPMTVLMLERLNMNTDDLKGLCFVLTPLTRYNFYKEISNNSTNVWSGPTFRALINSMDKNLVKNSLPHNDISRSEIIKNFIKKQKLKRFGLIGGIILAVLIIAGLSIGLGVGLTREKPSDSTIAPVSISTTTISYDLLNLNSKFIKSDGLVNYWPFQYNFKDVIDGSSLYNGVNVYFENDRFGNPHSALQLLNGKMTMPTLNYFNFQEFSVLVWVKPIKLSQYSTILSFSNELGSISCYLGRVGVLIDNPTFQIYFEKKYLVAYDYNLIDLKINEWSHLAFVLKFPLAFVYLNGTLISRGHMNLNDAKIFNKTYPNSTIGYDVYHNKIYRSNATYSVFDELKIFNRSLSADEINFEMSNEMYYSIPNFNEILATYFLNINYNANYNQSFGLINYWPFFNDTKDVIGLNHLGNRKKLSFINDRFNQKNASLLLGNEIILMPPNVYFANKMFSLMAWFKINGKRSFIVPLVKFHEKEDKIASNMITFYLRSSPDHQGPGCEIYNNNKSFASVKSNKSISDNSWQHVAFISEYPNFLIYLNGDELIANQTVETFPNNLIHFYNEIGDLRSSYSLNELKIFNRSLTKDEIKFEMENRIYVSNKNVNYSRSKGLVNYWSFFRNGKDMVGKKDLSLTEGINASLTQDRFNNPNSALDLSYGYLEMPEGVYFDSKSFSLLLWIYPRSLNASTAILTISNGMQINQISFYLNGPDYSNENMYLDFYKDPSVVTSVKYYSKNSHKYLSLHEWVHLSFVFDNSYIFIYINGSLAINGICTECEFGQNKMNRTVNYLGFNLLDSTTMDGVIDEVKIFNKALNNKQIKFEMSNELFNNLTYSNTSTNYSTNTSNPNYVKPQNLINYWPFEGNGNDVVGSDNFYGGSNVSFVSDRFNRSNAAVDFSYGFYKLPPNAYFSSKMFSLLTWIYPKSLDYYSVLLNVGNYVDDMLIFYYSDYSGSPGLLYFVGNQIQESILSSHRLIVNKWQHLAFVLDSSIIKIYLDGKKIGDGYIGLKLVDTRRNLNFVGTSVLEYEESLFSNVIIDELKIFNRSLSESELKDEMHNDMFI